MQETLSKRNPFAIATHRFEAKLNELDLFSYWDLREIMDSLPHLRFKEGYTLDGCRIGDKRDSIMRLYVYEQDSTDKYNPGPSGEKPKPIPFKDGQVISGLISYEAFETVPPIEDYLDIDFTQESIWEAVLLIRESCNYLKHGWHGGYNNGRLVVDVSSLIQVATDKLVESSLERWIKDERIAPKVDMLDDNHAKVAYCHWSDWRGLDYIVLLVTRDGRSLKFKEISKETLEKYDCGIIF